MSIFLLLPVLVPFLTAVVTMLFWHERLIQRRVNVVGGIAFFVAALGLLALVWRDGIQATQIGNWPAPFGITLVADLFSAIMVVMAGLMGLVVAVYSLGSIDERREAFGYYPLLHTLLMGVSGAFLTGDMFNLYVWFEVMLIASFVLMALGGQRDQLEGALKYVTINLLSSALFLTSVGILYSVTGTLNMADLAHQISSGAVDSGLATVLAMMFLVAFGIKAGLFPLFFWLPASYHTPPIAITALFSGLLTKVGVYALVRVFTLIFVQDVDYTHTLLMVIAGLTMVTGVLGAVAQTEVRRLLSFHIISQIGYLLMGLGLFTELALTGVIVFMVHVIIAKSALFLVSGIVRQVAGSYDLKQLGGLYRTNAGLAALFFLPALALAGLPPFSGFWAKLTLVRAGLETEEYAIVAVSLVVSVLTLFSMTKIWAEAFWKDRPGQDEAFQPLLSPQRIALLGPVIVLAALTVILGLGAEPLIDLGTEAAAQLLNPSEYIQAVLGDVA
ncbi:MAG: Na+/H+ antiporter subunit D [Chloroflexi bacterium]|nr:Na+/H+ antiporter subunit D [Chloroflexota bacterium]